MKVLEIQPKEVRFPFEKNSLVYSELSLSNPNHQYVQFKLRVTNPYIYTTRPANGILQLGETVKIRLSLLTSSFLEPESCNHIIQIQAIIVEKKTKKIDHAKFEGEAVWIKNLSVVWDPQLALKNKDSSNIPSSSNQLTFDQKEQNKTAKKQHNQKIIDNINNLTPAKQEQAAKKIALIIGNNKYKNLPELSNCVRDAELVEKTLRGNLGFETTILTDCTQEKILLAVKKFARTIEDGNVVFFYFSGHAGQQSKNNKQENFLFGVDAEHENSGETKTISGVKLNKDIIKEFDNESIFLIVIDACRLFPEENEKYKSAQNNQQIFQNLAQNMTLAAYQLPEFIGRGQFDVVYACQPGKFAIEKQDSKYGYLADFLCQSLKEKKFWHDVLFDVKENIYKATNGRQLPSVVSNVWVKLNLQKCTVPWKKTENSNNVQVLKRSNEQFETILKYLILPLIIAIILYTVIIEYSKNT